MEWDTPIGEAKACGGDALMRAAALAKSTASTNRSSPAKSRSCAFDFASPRLEESSPRRRNDAARCRDDALRPMVEADGSGRARLCRRGGARTARRPNDIGSAKLRSNWIWGLACRSPRSPWRGRRTVGVCCLLLAATRCWLGASLAIADAAALRAATPCSMPVYRRSASFRRSSGNCNSTAIDWRGRRTRLIEYKGAAT